MTETIDRRVDLLLRRVVRGGLIGVDEAATIMIGVQRLEANDPQLRLYGDLLKNGKEKLLKEVTKCSKR